LSCPEMCIFDWRNLKSDITHGLQLYYPTALKIPN
jgi:hypothetical protein